MHPPEKLAGGGFPHTPSGQMGKEKHPISKLLVIPAFVASQKCKSFALRQNHITRAVALAQSGLEARCYRGRYSRARGEG